MGGIELLVLFSLAAIGIIAAVMHMLGRSNRVRCADETEARQLIQEQLPDNPVLDVELSSSGEQAMAQLDGAENLALLRAAGSKWTVRTLHPRDIRQVTTVNNNLRIKFADFADPDAIMTFEFADSAAKWAAEIEKAQAVSNE